MGKTPVVKSYYGLSTQYYSNPCNYQLFSHRD